MSVLSDLVKLFERQVGIQETPVNNVIYNTDYYGTQVNGDQYPWCAAFIWDVFRMAGQSKLFLNGEKSAYCPYIEGWAKEHGRWVTDGYRQGDLLLYDWDGDRVPDHIGFCTHWSGNSGVAIEGNSNNMVQRLTRNSSQVLGAYRPYYPLDNYEPAPASPSEPAKKPAKTDAPGTYTVKEGDSLWGIAAQFLGNGVKYPSIMEANGLKSSMIHPGQVLKIPGESDRRTFTVTVSPETYRLLFDAAAADNVDVGVIVDKLVGGKV